MITVLVLSTSNCSSCKKAKTMLERMQKDIRMNIEEYDIMAHPGLLQKYPIMSMPGIVINGKLEFTGLPDEKKLREKLLNAREDR